MKYFKRLILLHLKNINDALQDPLQLKDDAINLALHYSLHHMDCCHTCACILFVDFSSAFNNIIPDLLSDKLKQFYISPSVCCWIINFLSNRKQYVKMVTTF